MKYFPMLLAFFFHSWLVADDDLYTNVYVVPPTFLQSSNQTSQEFDPFQTLRPKPPRKTAKEVLETAGITFPKGGSAVYNPANSQLIVRNTKDQLELVEAYIDSIRTGVEKQLYVTVQEISIDGSLTQGRGDDFDPKASAFLSEIEKTIDQKKKAQKNPNESVTRFRSLASFREHLTTDPDELTSDTNERIEFSAPALSRAAFQHLVKQLKGEKQVTFHHAPTVMSRSGEAFVTRIEERRYGISAVLGPDEFTVDLHAFIPEPGKALENSIGEFDTRFSKRIYDADIAVFVSQLGDTPTTRIVFVSVQIIDPAGNPIHEKGGQAAEKESKSKAAESQTPKQAKRVPSQEEAAAIKEADNLAATGLWYLSNDLFNEATVYFSEALETLPRLEILQNRRAAFEKQLANAKESADGGPRKVSLLQERMKLVTISSFELKDKSPLEAFTAFLQILLEQNEAGLFPQTPPKLLFENVNAFKDQPITLRLTDTSLLSTLEYLCKVTHSSYEFDGNAIRVTARATEGVKGG